MERVIIVSSLARSLVNFRLDLIKSLIKKGYEVHCTGPDLDIEVINNLGKINVVYHHIPFNRNGFSILRDIKYMIELRKLLIKLRPTKVLSYTIKPVIFSNIASFFLKTDSYSLITGIGFYGNKKESLKENLIENVITILYKIAFVKIEGVAFQNNDDKSFFLKKGIKLPTKTVITSGSGVNLERFAYNKIKEVKTIKFLFVGRLLKSKGVEHFINAAKILKKEFKSKVSFTIVGIEDYSSKDSINPDSLYQAIDKGEILFYKNQKNVFPFLENCSVFVLPSYYREGIPRSLLEALSVGRAIVTTDNVGCRETVIQKINGVLIEPNNLKALIVALRFLIENKNKIVDYSVESRKYAERRFDVSLINKDVIKMMS